MKRVQKPLQKTRDLGHQQKRIIEGVVFVIQTIRLSVPGTVPKRSIKKLQTCDMIAVIILYSTFEMFSRAKNNGACIVMHLVSRNYGILEF